MRHADLWRAIDRLASKNGLSVSGLARRSGLDPTSFNKSKRHSAKGKPRWPNTESIAKVLAATNSSLGDFLALFEEHDRPGPPQQFPLIALSLAGRGGDPSIPSKLAPSAEKVALPNVKDLDAFALEIDTEAYAPILRRGGLVIVSPNGARRGGDGIAVALNAGQILLQRLIREDAESIVLQDLSTAGGEIAVARSDVAWLARILWASQ